RPGAAGIGRAAIPLLVHLQPVRSVGNQTAHFAGDPHCAGFGMQRDPSADQAAGRRSEIGDGLIGGAGGGEFHRFRRRRGRNGGDGSGGAGGQQRGGGGQQQTHGGRSRGAGARR